jgi:hypothetical protein
VKFERDPRDRYYRERLAGSTLASLIVHALLAILLFSVLVSSSQQGTAENVQGAEIVALQRVTPVVLRQPAANKAALPVPHVPRVAPVRHAPLVQPRTQRMPQNRHELARIVPSAPPNPLPVPVASPQPNPQPTSLVLEARPSNQLPAAPLSIPTLAPVSVALKRPPTAAPSPVVTSAPTSRPPPRPPVPAALPTAQPATPAPIRPSALSAATPAAVRVSAPPSGSPAPLARASAAPAARAGVPSPSPAGTPAASRAAGPAASPGPRGQASPGPRPGAGSQARLVPRRPIAVAPTPSPVPHAPRTPAPAAVRLQAELRALIPTGPVHPTMKQYTPAVTLRGSLTPTPPPSVLAQTRYLYEVHDIGGEREIKMWVTSTRRLGPTTLCTGWLVRFPQAARAEAQLPNNVHIGPANGTQVTIGGGSAGDAPAGMLDAGLTPIVEGIVSTVCDRRYLVPFAAPSP